MDIIDSVSFPNPPIDMEVVQRFLTFARGFADEEVLSDETLTGADLRLVADWVQHTASAAHVQLMT